MWTDNDNIIFEGKKSLQNLKPREYNWVDQRFGFITLKHKVPIYLLISNKVIFK